MEFCSLSKKISILIDWMLDWVWPKNCFGCNTEGKWCCDDCLKKIKVLQKQKCPVCRNYQKSGNVCNDCRGLTNLDRLIVCCGRSDLLRDLIHSFKYQDIKGLDCVLVDFFEKAVKDCTFDLITWVPLSKERFNWRGYNQSEILARGLSIRLNIKSENLIFRTVNTKPQVKLSKDERLKNLEGVFCASPDLLWKVKGKTILLVDDVATTLSTLNECAKILKKSGAKNVWGVVLARGL